MTDVSTGADTNGDTATDGDTDSNGDMDGNRNTDIPTVRQVSGTAIPLRGNDIDTDQIIPSRFMKVVTFDGLGEFAFFDQRYDDADTPKDHPLNEARFQDASVMVVNANFGCGSSREHAPQALKRWGIDALVGESFAEIFAGNCLALGIPTVTADREIVVDLQEWIDENPGGIVEVDVVAEAVRYGDLSVAVTVDEAQRQALVEGIWDTTALLKSNREAIRETAADLPYVEDR